MQVLGVIWEAFWITKLCLEGIASRSRGDLGKSPSRGVRRSKRTSESPIRSVISGKKAAKSAVRVTISSKKAAAPAVRGIISSQKAAKSAIRGSIRRLNQQNKAKQSKMQQNGVFC